MSPQAHLWHWLNSNAGAVQALASAGALLLTAVLSIISYWYAGLTRDSLKLAKAQFDRHWRPDLGIRLEYQAPYGANLLVHNISNSSVVITGVLIKPSDTKGPATSYVVNHPVDAHTKECIPVSSFLIDAIHVEGPERTRGMLLGVDYQTFGTIGMVGLIEYVVRATQGNVVEIHAIDVIPRLR